MRFSMSPRAQYIFAYRWRAWCSSRASDVTIKRGLASPLVHSALAITRRSLLQLARVRRAKSLKRRSGLPVLWLSSAAVASSAPNPPTNRRLRARPNRKSTPLFSHQVISPSRAKPASARSRIRTASTVGDDPAHLFDAAGTRVDVGRAQFGRQQMPAAEHIERQIAIIVVIAMKEALFLVPVQRVVGGVEIKDDLRRDRGMGVEKEIDEQAFDFRRVIADPVITRRFRPAQLQPVERRLVGFRAPGKST